MTAKLYFGRGPDDPIRIFARGFSVRNGFSQIAMRPRHLRGSCVGKSFHEIAQGLFVESLAIAGEEELAMPSIPLVALANTVNPLMLSDIPHPAVHVAIQIRSEKDVDADFVLWLEE